MGGFFSNPLPPHIEIKSFFEIAVGVWVYGNVKKYQFNKIVILKKFNTMKADRKIDEASKKQLENMKTYLRRLLQADGKYKKCMSPFIDLIAADLLYYRAICARSLQEEYTVEEVSREEHTRVRLNPVENLRIWWSKRIQSELEAIGFNGKNIFAADGDDDDAIAQLLNEYSEDE